MVAAKTENTDRIVAFVAVENAIRRGRSAGGLQYYSSAGHIYTKYDLLSGDFGDYTSIRTNANHWAKMDQAESTACVIR